MLQCSATLSTAVVALLAVATVHTAVPRSAQQWWHYWQFLQCTLQCHGQHSSGGTVGTSYSAHCSATLSTAVVALLAVATVQCHAQHSNDGTVDNCYSAVPRSAQQWWHCWQLLPCTLQCHAQHSSGGTVDSCYSAHCSATLSTAVVALLELLQSIATRW